MNIMSPLFPRADKPWSSRFGLYWIVRPITRRRDMVCAPLLCLSLILYLVFDSLTLPYLLMLPLTLLSYKFSFVSFAFMVWLCLHYQRETDEISSRRFLTLYLIGWKVTVATYRRN